MMEIGTPACSMTVRVVCLLSCRVILRSPVRLSNRPNSFGVPLRANWRAQLVGDDVLAAGVPVEQGEPGLIRRTRVRALLQLELAQRRERVIGGSVGLLLRDVGSSIRTFYSTSTRAWFTVRVLAFRSISDQRRPSSHEN